MGFGLVLRVQHVMYGLDALNDNHAIDKSLVFKGRR